MNPEEKITYFAETDFRNKKTKFGIKAKDRSRHMYVIGMTGMGKSTMLENLAIQDIQSGEGVAFIDPHGGTAEKLLSYIPEHRIKDVVYFAPFDTDFPISFNVLDGVESGRRHLVVGGLMSAFKKVFADSDGKNTFSDRMEYILSNTLLALAEYPDATLLGVNRMYSDKEFRRQVLEHVTDPSVRAYWFEEYAKYEPKFATEATAAIQNKIGQFTGNPLIRNLIGQVKSSFDIREIMDTRKIFIVNLSKGRVGEDNANLLGSMLITKMYLAAMSRADVPESEMRHLPSFNFFVDEFQSFASDSFASILSEARKYKLNLTIAHQYVEQMSPQVRAAVFGNVGTMVIFRVGSTDAEAFEKEFAPYFVLEDIVSLSQRQIYLRLMIDGVGSHPFSAVTLPPIPLPDKTFKQQVIDASRMQYAHSKHVVEENIKAWHAPIVLSEEIKQKIKEENLVKKGIEDARAQEKRQFTPPAHSGSQAGGSQNARPNSSATFSRPQFSSAPKSQFTKLQQTPVSTSGTQGRSVHQSDAPSQSVQVERSTPKPTSLKDALAQEGLLDKSHGQKVNTISQDSTVSALQNTTTHQQQSKSRVSLSQLLDKTKQAPVQAMQVKEKQKLKEVLQNVQVSHATPQEKEVPQVKVDQKETMPSAQPQAKSDSKEIPIHVLRKILE